MKTITPLFLGGADAVRTAELRVPSIKGQLRFWYRATEPDFRLHERRLFGSTDEGQSGVVLSLADVMVLPQPAGEQWAESGLGYLGFGPVLYDKAAKAQVTQRPYLKPGTGFTLRCTFRPWLTNEDKAQIMRAVKAWTLFGGLGSRSRRGFGSLQVKKLGTEWSGPPNNLDMLKARCRECLDLIDLKGDPNGPLPEHTAFSSQSVIKLVPIPSAPSDWGPALAWVGQELSRFRSCYGNKNVRFRPDHNLFYDVINGKDPGRCPERHVFGLPHNYFKSKNGKRKMEVIAEQVTGLKPDGSESVTSLGRRGSPLFIRLHRLAGGEFVALFAFLPARFLPDNSRLVMTSDNGHVFRHNLPVAADWSPITGLWKQLAKSSTVQSV